MKILILSTFGHYGGAATCAKRLYQALNRHNVDVEIRALQFYDSEEIKSLFSDSFFKRILVKFNFILERLQVLFQIRERKYLYKFSSGSTGFRLSRHPMIKAADIIHLQWINFGLISIEEISNLAQDKKVIWTQHDMWSFTGGCHYALTCELYRQTCNDCLYLSNSRFSERVQSTKLHKWETNAFKVPATSNWLANCAGSSSIFKNWEVDVLPTPIDSSLFKPLDKQKLKEKYQIDSSSYNVLFGAVDLKDERKGFRYLIEALKYLEEELPDLHLITFGKQTKDVFHGSVTELGHIDSSEKLTEIYNLADVFVLPSIQDNLPNTVMEAMSCGVPVVAFDSGGASDMVDHLENGFLAENQNARLLAKGIKHFEDQNKRLKAGVKARKKIEETFSEAVLTPKYLDLYKSTLAR